MGETERVEVYSLADISSVGDTVGPVTQWHVPCVLHSLATSSSPGPIRE